MTPVSVDDHVWSVFAAVRLQGFSGRAAIKTHPCAHACIFGDVRMNRENHTSDSAAGQPGPNDGEANLCENFGGKGLQRTEGVSSSVKGGTKWRHIMSARGGGGGGPDYICTV